MLQESILQYFRPSLSYHLSLRPLVCLFLSGRWRQVSLYIIILLEITDILFWVMGYGPYALFDKPNTFFLLKGGGGGGGAVKVNQE